MQVSGRIWLSRQLIDRFHDKGINLIVTADCGSLGDACEKAKGFGIDGSLTTTGRALPCLTFQS